MDNDAFCPKCVLRSTVEQLSARQCAAALHAMQGHGLIAVNPNGSVNLPADADVDLLGNPI